MGEKGSAALGDRQAAAQSEGDRRLKQLLEFLAKTLVDNPDQVRVDQFEEEDDTVVYELIVAEDDYGQIIGRGGRTAQALRTVVKAAAVKDNRRVLVDIVE